MRNENKCEERIKRINTSITKNNHDYTVKQKRKVSVSNGYEEIIKLNIPIFKAIIACFTLSRFKCINKFTYIIPDSLSLEFNKYLLYYFQINSFLNQSFYFTDFLLGKNVYEKLKIIEIEFNSLDSVLFSKMIAYINKYKSLETLKLSLFSKDILYTEGGLFKLFYHLTGKNKLNMEGTKTAEDFFLNEFLKDFEENMEFLFHIILKKVKNLKEFGLVLYSGLSSCRARGQSAR